jgi:hypothetical protein
MSELDNVFSGTAEEVSEPASPEVEIVTSESEVVETEKPKEIADQTADETEAKAEVEPESWTKKAVIDERRKRQALEDDKRKLEAELAALKESIPKRDVIDARLDVLEDPDGFSEAISSRIEKAAIETRINLSREMMIDRHDDYEEKEQIFIEYAKEHPELQQQALKSSNPAKFVYEEAKKFQEFQQIKDGTYVEKLKAELKEQVRKELEAERSKTSGIRPSLAKESSANNDQFVEPDLASIFKR